MSVCLSPGAMGDVCPPEDTSGSLQAAARWECCQPECCGHDNNNISSRSRPRPKCACGRGGIRGDGFSLCRFHGSLPLGVFACFLSWSLKRRFGGNMTRREDGAEGRGETGRAGALSRGGRVPHPSIHLLDLLYPRLGWWTCPLDIKHRPASHCGICVRRKLVKYSQDGCEVCWFHLLQDLQPSVDPP